MQLLKFLFVLLLTVSCSNSENETPNNDNNNTDDQTVVYDQAIMDLINAYRVKNKRPKLKPSDVLQTQTEKHTRYMVKSDKLSHELFNDRTAYIKKHLKTSTVAENVAYNYSDKAADVVNQWINSSGHRKNMLGDYTHFYVTAQQSNNGKWFYTTLFAKLFK